MEFVKTEKKYVDACLELAINEYCLEKTKSHSLNNIDCKNYLRDLLTGIFESQYGMIAIDNGKVVGYLSFYGGIEGHFGSAIGSFSPLFGSAFGGKNRGKVASLLFQNLSELMTQDKMSSFAICKYAHDEEIVKSLVLNGFGIRCADAIKDIRGVKDVIKNTSYSFDEVGEGEIINLLELKNGLQKHLNDSPVYFPHFSLDKNKFAELCKQRDSRFFTAKDDEKIIGYIEVDDSGETFVTEEGNIKNICGMYLDRNFRGTGLAEDLLNFVANCFKKENMDYLSVDFETINPTALRFWSKHFEVYTYSFIRRIDERILK